MHIIFQWTGWVVQLFVCSSLFILHCKLQYKVGRILKCISSFINVKYINPVRSSPTQLSSLSEIPDQLS